MNLKTSWVLQIDPSVFKTLKKLTKKDQKRILSIIKQLENDPHFGDIQKMKDEKNVWRRRTGSYRIFFEIYAEERVIHVFQVERRTTTTY